MTLVPIIVGLGEALFDVFPHDQLLGGAPLNVAVHAHQLLSAYGGQGVVASRVGPDALGQQVIDSLRSRGLTTDYIQVDEARPTGTVLVTLDAGGQPAYEIVRDVAWDNLALDDHLHELATRCHAVCFGTLAQRSAKSRRTIHRFVEAAPQAVRLFDVNLRQSFFDRAILEESCRLSSALKLNEQELPVVAGLLGTGGTSPDRQAAALLDRCHLQYLALTRAERGTILYTPDARYEGQPVHYPPVPAADSVGAGDACSAGLLAGLVLNWPLASVVDLANRAGAYVASQPGATPALPPQLLARIT